MADKREMILARLAALMTETITGAGIKTAVRNRGMMGNEKRPGAVILDADERVRLSHSRRNGRGYGMTPQIMTMSPELYIILDEKRPTNEDVGPILNTMRIALCQAIAQDGALRTLTGSNGEIVYNGCVTDLKSGSALTGQMRLDFSFNYVFDPTAA